LLQPICKKQNVKRFPRDTWRVKTATRQVQHKERLLLWFMLRHCLQEHSRLARCSAHLFSSARGSARRGRWWVARCRGKMMELEERAGNKAVRRSCGNFSMLLPRLARIEDLAMRLLPTPQDRCRRAHRPVFRSVELQRERPFRRSRDASASTPQQCAALNPKSVRVGYWLGKRAREDAVEPVANAWARARASLRSLDGAVGGEI